MDLREKPGKVQKFLELMLRFRLIFVVLMVILAVTIAAGKWQEMNSLPLAASLEFSQWTYGFAGVSSLMDSARYLGVAFLSAFVLLVVFGGVRAGIGGLLAGAVFAGSLFLLDGSEGMQLIFLAAVAGLSLVLLLFARWSVACAFFPFVLAWMLLTAVIAWFPIVPGEAWLVWAVLSSLGFAGAVAFALVSGGELGAGAPKSGAVLKAARKMVVPVLISSFLALAAITVDLGNVTGKAIAGAIVVWIFFVVWFFGFFFGTASFAPWERLRAGSRRVEMKDKKKKKK